MKTKEEIIKEYEKWDNIPENTPSKFKIYFDENEFGLEDLEITLDEDITK